MVLISHTESEIHDVMRQLLYSEQVAVVFYERVKRAMVNFTREHEKMIVNPSKNVITHLRRGSECVFPVANFMTDKHGSMTIATNVGKLGATRISAIRNVFITRLFMRDQAKNDTLMRR